MTHETNPKYFIPDFKGKLPDRRLDDRADKLARQLSKNPCSSVRRLSGTSAEHKANLRFLNNEKVEEEVLIKELSERVGQIVTGRDVLVVTDTCEVNMSDHKGRLKPNSGLGRSDKSDTGHCFKIHPGMVMDASSLNPLGFSWVKVFHRDQDMPYGKKRNYKKQAIEEKESYKWIEVAQKSKDVLSKAATVTIIEDREGDIYEQFALIPDEKTHLIIRSRTTRKLANGSSLYAEVEDAPVVGEYEIDVPTDKRKGQYKRKATIELRFTTCEIKCPANLSKKGYPPSIEVTCISAKEIGNVSNPISWRLLTTHRVENFEDALQIVFWYTVRWYIEQVFRLLKRQGFGIEQSELTRGWALRKLVVLQLSALLKILQMNIAYSHPEGGQPIEEVFDDEQIEVLQKLDKKLKGNTHRLQNNNNPKTTKWAAWIIARLGGWKGYDSQGL
ncbi:MAG: IS4 family transposase, partial [Gelidibacter sp.]|nr:IS4 family transposase [Gelidibacter sp.]